MGNKHLRRKFCHVFGNRKRSTRSGKHFPSMRNASRSDEHASLPSRTMRQKFELIPYGPKFAGMSQITMRFANPATFREIGKRFPKSGKATGHA